MLNCIDKKAERLIIGKTMLELGGKPFYLASGDMHYFRLFKEGWERRLRLMKDFGLTAVQTYVPWNLHEPEEGQFNFEGNLNIAEFLELCDKIELKVMSRPSPYICSEWDFGGLPYWIMNKEKLTLRNNNEAYMGCVTRYYERLTKEFVPYLSTNGGPIIAVAVENEYGSFGNDGEYIKALGDLLIRLGVDVPLYTADGIKGFWFKEGSRYEYWTMLDSHNLDGEAANALKTYQPDKPVAVAELWGGRGQRWGMYFDRQAPETVADAYAAALEIGAFVNLYMFCGGTNFGFLNGALAINNQYTPFVTSYDVDAPVTEYGMPTEKYYALKSVLKKYTKEHNIPFTGTDDMGGYTCKKQKIENVELTESADFLDSVPFLAEKTETSAMPLTFEDMGQDYGFMLYSTYIEYTGKDRRVVTIEGLHDRATVYANGEYVGCLMRDREMPTVEFSVPEEGVHLEILVENTGRVNFGCAMNNEKKGILGYVSIAAKEEGDISTFDCGVQMHWENTSLPCRDMGKADFKTKIRHKRPAIFKGKFKAVPGVDTFFNPEGWGKGFVMINGFNIGRYWSVGPQGTLYVPGELLKEDNEIIITEIEDFPDNLTVCFDDMPSLDTIKKA